MTALRFTVYGTPIPKGSMKAYIPKGWKRPVLTHDNAKTKPWQEAVTWSARETLRGAKPIAGPVRVTVTFFLPRPKSTPRKVAYPVKRPDLDKLLRLICDGLTRAGAYRDDSQVVSVTAGKAFGDVPGAEITVEAL